MPGRVGDHDRVDAVALAPHDVVEHVRDVDGHARAPVALVAGHSPQGQRLARQAHPLGGRLNVAEAEVKGDRVLDPLLVAQRHDQPVQRRFLRAPRDHVQTPHVENLIRRSDRRPQPLLIGLVHERGVNLDTARRFNPQRQRARTTIVGRHRHHVHDVRRRPGLQRHLAEQTVAAHRRIHQQHDERMRVNGLQRAGHVEGRRNETVRTETNERSINPRVEGAGEPAESQRQHPAALNRLLQWGVEDELAAQNRGARQVGGLVVADTGGVLLVGLTLTAHPRAVQLEDAGHRRRAEILMRGSTMNQLRSGASGTGNLPGARQHLKWPARPPRRVHRQAVHRRPRVPQPRDVWFRDVLHVIKVPFNF